MILQCPVLQAGKLIPSRYAYHGVPGGQNLSLPLLWADPPANCQSYLLTIVDRHPVANNWVHWCLVNIPSDFDHLKEGISRRGPLPAGSIELRNSFGEIGYGGPKPPRGSGPHEYVITLFGLTVGSIAASTKTGYSEAMKMIASNILATASTSGIFEQ